MELASRLTPCGPVVDAAAARRAHEALTGAADEGGWRERLDQAWPALAPVFAASSYLAGLTRRRPAMLAETLGCDPDQALDELILETRGAAGEADAAARLRRAKTKAHLLTALCDLGGVWDLDQVTGALTRFADAALAAALDHAVAAEVAAGRLELSPGEPLPGYFYVAMGKYGAFELNYSSDIDYTAFYDPGQLPLAAAIEPQPFAVRLTQAVAGLMQDRTADGYVFRVDLRLRPDPLSTPVAVTVDAALDYYQTVGQNWERAAFIKARACAGDLGAANAFLAQLSPFIWRRHLDFAAIEDIHSIKRQIHVHKVDDRLDPRGADLKLGRGGIREVEFYAQTLQLIHGGRNPALRSPRTVDALASLAEAGHVPAATAAELTAGYVRLRALEHRAQMIADEQTHRLPEADAARRAIGALAGYRSLKSFDTAAGKLLAGVNGLYGDLFAEDEDLSSTFGSLVFTGVEGDPETLRTLARMGFSSPPKVAETIRAWHHGRIPATRTERGRELFTRLAPRLLEAMAKSGAADAAFARFTTFFAGLTAGVQVQSLLLAQPDLMGLVVSVLAYAPNLAQTLARQPAALDALLDRRFFEPLDPEEIERAVAAGADAEGFEAVMDAARRAFRDQSFRVGVQLIAGTARAGEAGPAFTAIAQGCLGALAPAALAENIRLGGAFPGEVAVIGFGKFGSREMSAGSDLDLVVVYGGHKDGAASAGKGWWAETFWGRFTQRLTAALSAPTAEGGLYEVDLKLRPYGSDGAIAVSLKAFEDYYAEAAETWELLALTRARVAWTSSPAFGRAVETAIEAVLRKPRDRARLAADTRAMRRLIEKEKPPKGEWDLKLIRGGLIDLEFVAQFLQLGGAPAGGALVVHTGQALAAASGDAAGLLAAWTMQQDLYQLFKVALADGVDVAREPAGFLKLLADSAGEPSFQALGRRLREVQAQARSGCERILGA